MRIIKAAKKRDELITNCAKCRSMLGVREGDVKWYSGAWSYVCPVCSTTNYFEKEDKLELFPWIMEDENDRRLQSDNSMRINEI